MDTTKQKAKEFLQNFIKEINEQDNRCTATPYFYVIRTANWVSSYNEGEGDRVVLCGCEGFEYFAETEEELFGKFIEGSKDEYPEIKKMDEFELKDFLEEKEYSIYWEKKEWKEECCFFTETEANEHLRLNDYHYSKDAHIYVKHFWRAPMVKKFFESVAILCDIEHKNH